MPKREKNNQMPPSSTILQFSSTVLGSRAHTKSSPPTEMFPLSPAWECKTALRETPPVNHRCKGRWTTPTVPTKTWHKLQTTTSGEWCAPKHGGAGWVYAAWPQLRPNSSSAPSQKFLEAEGSGRTSQKLSLREELLQFFHVLRKLIPS